jgi:hypothetical protein
MAILQEPSTMKFRPLSVDYHSRAQEIVAAERDIHARRMAPRSLPNPSPPCDRRRRRRRRCQNSQSEDGIGPGGRGDVPLDGDEETVKSISSADDDDIDDRGQAIGQVVERLRENCVDSLGPTRRVSCFIIPWLSTSNSHYLLIASLFNRDSLFHLLCFFPDGLLVRCRCK